MSSLLISYSAINRFARVATMRDTGVNELGQAGLTRTHRLTEFKTIIIVAPQTPWSNAEWR